MAAPRLGENVFILGAGASAHAGVPLMADFISRARSLLRSLDVPSLKRELRYKDRFQRALVWIDKLRSAAYHVEFNADNLEHVFSLALLAKEAGDSESAEIYECLKFLILETIDQSVRLAVVGQRRLQADQTYNHFLERIQKISGSAERPGQFEPDPIITFNYDVLLDNAIQFGLGYQIDYGLSDTPRGPRWLVCKLHGSLNWAEHKDCPENKGTALTVLPPNPIPPGYSLLFPEPGQLPFRMATHVMYETKCPGCSESHKLTPVLMPPTWSKSPSEHRIGPVWARAVQALAKATSIIIIGYSLPETDTFFPYLMSLALRDNSDLRRIVVVNRDNSGLTQARYERIFARSLRDRGAFEYVPTTFVGFIDSSKFEEVLRSADLPY